MSASNPTEKNAEGKYSFQMKQPIPIYLMALAVGELEFAPIGERTGVYSEPSMIKACAAELVDMEKMLAAAEKLYGKYLWERYDVIVLPPSFPFGGMENPRLTFATPTIIAGDRSLVSLIAHELAHSWSGNLVTNATWDDFWLNEGFTVYFENRIMEELYGKEYAEMLLLLAEQDLRAEIDQMNADGKEQDTYLKLRLAERDPDEGMTSITYDKGAFFLRMLEHAAGRERFDAFLSSYFRDHRFTNVTTEDFVSYLKKNLLEKHKITANVDEWVYGPGLPASHVPIVSVKFQKVEESLAKFESGTPAKDIVNPEWSTHEKLHFIKNLKPETTVEKMKELDAAFGFSASGNAEILAAWFVQSINRGYMDKKSEMEAFLVRVGRRKLLTPIYESLAKTPEGKQFATGVYRKARPNYHSVSTGTIDKILGYPS
jgi:aminopeptidase N